MDRIETIRSTDAKKIELLSKLVWYLRLDLKRMQICVRPTDTESNMMTVKELLLFDVEKFGIAPENDEYEVEAEPYLCATCAAWLSGFCYKHPLIFVKEKTPVERPYSVEATFPPFFFLADSTIPKAGKGVFTSIPLPSGIAFGPYSGFVSTSRKAETSGYSWQIHQLDGSDCWVDAKNPFYSNWMRYVNCARFEEEQNLIALLYNRNIYYYTYKSIVANEELFVWYGKDYGEYLGIENALTENGPLAPPKVTEKGKTSPWKSHEDADRMTENLCLEN